MVMLYFASKNPDLGENLFVLHAKQLQKMGAQASQNNE
jgi:hypothetical protein